MIEADKKGHKNKGCKHYLTWRTILHFMDVSVPTNMDGVVLEEIFEEDGEFAGRPTECHERE